MKSNNRTVVIAGGSGLVGSALASRLHAIGWNVRILSRRPLAKSPYDVYRWDPSRGIMDESVLHDAYAVVNLSGADIGKKRWSEQRKKLLVESRIQSSRLLVETIERGNHGLHCFLNASAVGYYGDRKAEWCREDDPSSPGDFLSDLCSEWEQTIEFESLNIRRIILRIGIVLSNEGGIFPKIKPVHKMMVVPIPGTGRQYFPWIHIRDLVGIMEAVLIDEELEGIFNAVAPSPVTYKEFAASLSRSMNRPMFSFGIPEFLLRCALGEIAGSLTISQRVSCEKIALSGYQFTFSELQNAFEDLLGT